MRRAKHIADILQYGCNQLILQTCLPPLNLAQLPINFSADLKLLQRTAAHYQLPALSANQIKMQHRLFVVLKQDLIQPGKWFEYANHKTEDYETVINPELVRQSSIKFKDFEECPSIPGMRFHIWNPIMQTYKYHRPSLQGDKLKFQPAQITLQGFKARLWDHEVRHLNGILAFIESVSHREISVSDEYRDNPGMHEMVQLMKQEIKFMAKDNLVQYFKDGKKDTDKLGQFMPQDIPEKITKEMKVKMKRQYKKVKEIVEQQQKKQKIDE